MDKRERPIGFFDSGVGGLSVLRYAKSQLPKENFIYYGDSKNAPYGNKTEEEIKSLSLACGEFLYQKGVKAMVMACNTATSASVQKMRELYQMPVISIEPAVKPASEAPGAGKILVMATPATIMQRRYNSLVERLGCSDRVLNLPCGGLVELLETGDFENPAIRAYLEEKFRTVGDFQIRAIVLGCTHYSFIANTIQEVAKELLDGPLELFDGMYGMVRQLGRILREKDLESSGPGGQVELYSSGGPEDEAILRQVFFKK